MNWFLYFQNTPYYTFYTLPCVYFFKHVVKILLAHRVCFGEWYILSLEGRGVPNISDHSDLLGGPAFDKKKYKLLKRNLVGGPTVHVVSSFSCLRVISLLVLLMVELAHLCGFSFARTIISIYYQLLKYLLFRQLWNISLCLIRRKLIFEKYFLYLRIFRLMENTISQPKIAFRLSTAQSQTTTNILNLWWSTINCYRWLMAAESRLLSAIVSY